MLSGEVHCTSESCLLHEVVSILVFCFRLEAVFTNRFSVCDFPLSFRLPSAVKCTLVQKGSFTLLSFSLLLEFFITNSELQ